MKFDKILEYRKNIPDSCNKFSPYLVGGARLHVMSEERKFLNRILRLFRKEELHPINQVYNEIFGGAEWENVAGDHKPLFEAIFLEFLFNMDNMNNMRLLKETLAFNEKHYQKIKKLSENCSAFIDSGIISKLLGKTTYGADGPSDIIDFTKIILETGKQIQSEGYCKKFIYNVSKIENPTNLIATIHNLETIVKTSPKIFDGFIDFSEKQGDNALMTIIAQETALRLGGDYNVHPSNRYPFLVKFKPTKKQIAKTEEFMDYMNQIDIEKYKKNCEEMILQHMPLDFFRHIRIDTEDIGLFADNLLKDYFEINGYFIHLKEAFEAGNPFGPSSSHILGDVFSKNIRDFAEGLASLREDKVRIRQAIKNYVASVSKINNDRTMFKGQSQRYIIEYVLGLAERIMLPQKEVDYDEQSIIVDAFIDAFNQIKLENYENIYDGFSEEEARRCMGYTTLHQDFIKGVLENAYTCGKEHNETYIKAMNKLSVEKIGRDLKKYVSDNVKDCALIGEEACNVYITAINEFNFKAHENLIENKSEEQLAILFEKSADIAKNTKSKQECLHCIKELLTN